MKPNKELDDAIKARNEYLKKNPHMKAYQAELDTLLDKAVTPQNRLAVINFLIAERAMAAANIANKLIKGLKRETTKKE